MQFLNLVFIHTFVYCANINALGNAMEESLLFSMGMKHQNSFEESSISPWLVE